MILFLLKKCKFEHMMQYIDTIIIVVTVLAAVYLQVRRDQAKRKTENSASEKLDFDRAINGEIYPILWEILTAFDGARRVAITQFHNGGKFFSGNSINRMTMTHEVTRGTIAHVSKSIKDLIISRPFSITIDELLEQGVAVYNEVDKVEDIDLKNYLKFLKAKSMCSIIMRDSRDRPIGLIHVSSDEINIFTDPEVEGLKVRANNLASIFEHGIDDRAELFGNKT